MSVGTLFKKIPPASMVYYLKFLYIWYQNCLPTHPAKDVEMKVVVPIAGYFSTLCLYNCKHHDRHFIQLEFEFSPFLAVHQHLTCKENKELEPA